MAFKHSKYKTELCNNDMKFEDCELAILRHSIDKIENYQGYKTANSEEVTKMFKIVENFIIDNGLICYGGIAINNILPKHAQFYNKNINLPDYDFFSMNALDDAKKLANIFYKAGYVEVEAKSGMHPGTFKIYVNFIPVADITFLQDSIFNALKKDAIVIAGVHYAPVNFLRMSMFLELSRPHGDITRWEKVLKRLNTLNTYYPLTIKYECSFKKFTKKLKINKIETENLYNIIKNNLIEQEVVFFGGYAISLYSNYTEKHPNLSRKTSLILFAKLTIVK